jgi:glycosyltransferase involved in cell wall biosynthesis
VSLLVEAFGRVRAKWPDARLVIDVGSDSPPALRAPGVELVDARADGLASHYSTAWVTVLPSLREAFGLVLVESLASGTPAVGIADGGAAEILDDPQVGVLVRSESATALAEAIATAFELSAKPETRDACREHARRWDWDRLCPVYEALYREALGWMS